MKFNVDKKADINGTSLLKAITTTPSRMLELFGKQPGINNAKAKYSATFTVRHADTGEVFTLYRCYGEFRVGGFHNACTRLGELMQEIDPTIYAGFANVPSIEIMRHPLYADALPDASKFAA